MPETSLDTVPSPQFMVNVASEPPVGMMTVWLAAVVLQVVMNASARVSRMAMGRSDMVAMPLPDASKTAFCAMSSWGAVMLYMSVC